MCPSPPGLVACLWNLASGAGREKYETMMTAIWASDTYAHHHRQLFTAIINETRRDETRRRQSLGRGHAAQMGFLSMAAWGVLRSRAMRGELSCEGLAVHSDATVHQENSSALESKCIGTTVQDTAARAKAPPAITHTLWRRVAGEPGCFRRDHLPPFTPRRRRLLDVEAIETHPQYLEDEDDKRQQMEDNIGHGC
ncbi:hypothetical protein B0J11DRAFT_570327 [Dendryphion nanum]|uniref:Uncharacterized protein n=1 Tax=Dendryphion nanum TaxID=256645 RepID=A0A9P9DIM8_9PLEO|nr:hypothetical protein B0J11DRAFT_570327 [Dendryphion nanum]